MKPKSATCWICKDVVFEYKVIEVNRYGISHKVVVCHDCFRKIAKAYAPRSLGGMRRHGGENSANPLPTTSPRRVHNPLTGNSYPVKRSRKKPLKVKGLWKKEVNEE